MWSWVSGLMDWRARQGALGEFQQLRKQEAADEVWAFAGQLDVTRSAMDNAARGEALRLWAGILDRYRDNAVKSPKAMRLAIDLHRYDDAEALAREGLRRFPRQVFYLERLAEIAQRRGDLAEAVRRWAVVRKQFPGQPSGYIEGAACLRDLGQTDQAASILRSASRKFPESFECRLEEARLADYLGDWAGALPQWEALRAEFPHYVVCVTGQANSLAKLGRTEEAEAVLEAAKPSFPLELALSANLAWLAHNRGDWPLAAARWQLVRQKFPLEPLGYSSGIAALRELGRAADRDAVLREAAERFPHDAGFALDFAMLAHQLPDWPVAVARWDEFRARFPDREEGYRFGIEALTAAGRADEAEALRTAHTRGSAGS